MIRIDNKLLDKVASGAVQASRRRLNHNFHKEASDILQRMLNALEPDTYIAPHKHELPDKREAFVILRGRVLVVEFTEAGEIAAHIVLDRDLGNYGAEIPQRTYHTLICLSPGSIIYELKDGPYNPTDDKHFAPWAPSEAEPAAAFAYNRAILQKLGL